MVSADASHSARGSGALESRQMRTLGWFRRASRGGLDVRQSQKLLTAIALAGCCACMPRKLPEDWESLDDQFPVSRCAALISARRDDSPSLVAEWFEPTSQFAGDLAAIGMTVPNLELVRVDGRTDSVASGPNTSPERALQVARLLECGADGTLGLEGRLAGAAPAAPFVHEWNTHASLHPAERVSLQLGITFVAEFDPTERRDLSAKLTELLGRACASVGASVEYAELVPGHQLIGVSRWEYEVDPDLTSSAGALLARHWLRGVAPVTFINHGLSKRLSTPTKGLPWATWRSASSRVVTA
jgi:hypothetical protein